MALNAGNVFSAAALSEHMIQSLPREPAPQLRSPYDAVALLAHACMLAVGFRLVGLGEEGKIPSQSETDDSRPLPPGWNASSESNYAFRYAHSQSSLEYLVKVSRLGSKAVVQGLGIGDDKVHTVDFSVKDFVSESSFPFSLPSETGADSNAQLLRQLFISAGRLTDAGSLLKLRIISKACSGPAERWL